MGGCQLTRVDRICTVSTISSIFMILMSSFSTVLETHASGTERTNFGLAKIIKTFYDDHTIITGFFMILNAVERHAAPVSLRK